MYWFNYGFGIALYVNGKIAGWVTKTTNENYLYGVNNQKSTMKSYSDSEHQAKLKLLKLFD